VALACETESHSWLRIRSPSDVITGSAENFAYNSFIMWPVCAGKRADFFAVVGDGIRGWTSGVLFP